MRLITRIVTAGSLVALGIGGLGIVSAVSAGATPQSPTAPKSPTVGHVYVDDNTVTANTIAGFNRLPENALLIRLQVGL